MGLLEFKNINLVKEIKDSHNFLFYEMKNNKILDNISFNISANTITSILGSSGCGKTRIAEIVAGNIPINSTIEGQIYFNNKEISLSELAKKQGKEIIYVPQGRNCLDPTYLYSYEGKKYTGNKLSGGMASVCKLKELSNIKKIPKLLVLDEPTNSMSQSQINKTISDIKNYRDRGTAVIIITHDIDFALNISDEILLFSEHRIDKKINREDFKNNLFDNIEKNKSNFEHNNIITSLHAKNISKTYGNVSILDNFSFKFTNDVITSLQGEMGRGKSTLCKILANHIKPDSGSVELDLKHEAFPITKKLSKPNPVQLITQNPYSNFNPKITIKKNLRDLEELDISKLNDVHLDESILNKYSFEMSGGELQRLSIFRALSTKPAFVISDESTSMLDKQNEKLIFDYMIDYCTKHNAGLIFVSHDKHLINRYSGRYVTL